MMTTESLMYGHCHLKIKISEWGEIAVEVSGNIP